MEQLAGQMSLFDFIKPEIEVCFNPNEAYANIGSGYANSKVRISDFFKKNSDIATQISFLKKEYGTGGFGHCDAGPFSIHQGSHDAKGHKFTYYDGDMQEVEVVLTYKELAIIISDMIAKGIYTIPLEKEKAFCWDPDVNEVHKKLTELTHRYDASVREAAWEIWDHVPHLGYRMTFNIVIKTERYTKEFLDEMNEIVAYAKVRNVEISPMTPLGLGVSKDELSLLVFSTFMDKERRKRK